MVAVNSLVINILRNIFFCVQQKKETHTGLEQHEGEWTIIIKTRHLNWIPGLSDEEATLFKNITNW